LDAGLLMRFSISALETAPDGGGYQAQPHEGEQDQPADSISVARIHRAYLTRSVTTPPRIRPPPTISTIRTQEPAVHDPDAPLINHSKRPKVIQSRPPSRANSPSIFSVGSLSAAATV